MILIRSCVCIYFLRSDNLLFFPTSAEHWRLKDEKGRRRRGRQILLLYLKPVANSYFIDFCEKKNKKHANRICYIFWETSFTGFTDNLKKYIYSLSRKLNGNLH